MKIKHQEKELGFREKVWEVKVLAKHLGISSVHLIVNLRKLGINPFRDNSGQGVRLLLKENEVLIILQWRSPDKELEEFKLPFGWFWR